MSFNLVMCVRAQTVERPVVETHYVDRIVEKEVCCPIYAAGHL